MNLLALDTSSVACTVALKIDEDITASHEEQPREHTRLLLPMIRRLLDDAGVALQNIDAIVLGNGPGSFIGMRIAASVAQGLAFASGLKIIPVSSLAAIAAEVFADQDVVEAVVAQDAHMQEVYLGLYRRGRSGLPEAISAERLQRQDSIGELRCDASGPRVAAGFGWQRYPELLQQNRDQIDAVTDFLYPKARYLLTLAAARHNDLKGLNPQDVAPAYLRQKVAEKAVSSKKKV